MTLTFDLRAHKCAQLFYKYEEDPMKMAEKLSNADIVKKKDKKEIRKKTQNNNRKVFRLCRHTLNIVR